MQDNHEDFAATAVSIVVEHKPNQQLQIAVSALVPRKRTGADDAVTSKLVHYLFWDDKRYCTHLDALLTRLAPLSVVHLASTERAEVRKTCALHCIAFLRDCLSSHSIHLSIYVIAPGVQESLCGCRTTCTTSDSLA
jgi:hypothetical protein